MAAKKQQAGSLQAQPGLHSPEPLRHRPGSGRGTWCLAQGASVGAIYQEVEWAPQAVPGAFRGFDAGWGLAWLCMAP